MNLIKQIGNLFSTGTSFGNYYQNMNQTLKRVNNEYTMLHYPFYINDNDSFLQAQKNLTDYCINKLDSLEGKTVLEIGCGNGVQVNYIKEKFNPLVIKGIDLDEGNIKIANSEKERKNLNDIYFYVSDAQNIPVIEDQSIDVVINIESAFHYPDKALFLKEIFRVLKPGGYFLIADILTTKNKGMGVRRFWKKRMVLNHWHKYQYDSGISEAKLVLTHNEEITQNVIKGFKPYRRWINQIEKGSLINDLAFKLFYTINVYWYIYVLRYRRQYYIFVGKKP
jgi:ubiquinone/menaquinone biosynthesis C-methylase UbiE